LAELEGHDTANEEVDEGQIQIKKVKIPQKSLRLSMIPSTQNSSAHLAEREKILGGKKTKATSQPSFQQQK